LRYEQIFNQMDVHKNFYYSVHYDCSRSLQYNLSALPQGKVRNSSEMFTWNHHLTEAIGQWHESSWSLSIIHGFVDQAKISVFGHDVFVTLIARRSRY
jgi:hypothetical protein